MIRYEKTIWENDKTPVNAQHLGKVEDGLEYLFDVVKDVPAGEDARIANEKQRQANETTRKNNEIKRNDTLNAKVKEVDNAIAASNNNIKEVNNKFETIVASKQQDAEVILARDGEASLGARLERDLKKGKTIYKTVEGSYLSIDDTLDSYLQNIEIKGNTIQNPNDLADIKSVGDKVEEQELYKIPIKCCGKNLFNEKWINGYALNQSTGEVSPNASVSVTEFIKVTPGADIVLSKGFTTIFYDANKVKKGDASWGNKFRLSNDTHYIRFQSNTDAIVPSIVEYGVESTLYEPYKEHKITILSSTPLESFDHLKGKIFDRIIEKDGVWGVEKNVYHINPLTWGNVTLEKFDKSNLIRIAKANKVLKWYSWATNQIFNNKFEELLANTGWNNPNNHNKIASIISDTNIDIIVSKDIETKEQALEYIEGLDIWGWALDPQFIPLPHAQQIKLKSFANKTNIFSLTEIEGTIKADVPKSLGATVSSNTKAIQDLNKDLERVKRLEEATATTVTTESNFVTVEETNNGYFKGIKLEGKTLINKLFGGNGFGGNTLWFNNTFDKLGLKNNEEYTVVFDVPSEITKFAIYNTSSSNAICNQMGMQKTFKFNYLNSKGDNKMFLYSSSAITSEIASKCKVMILEGDHTQNPPNKYFEGMKSVGGDEKEIAISTDNNVLVDSSDLVEAFIGAGDGKTFKNDTSAKNAKSYIFKCPSSSKISIERDKMSTRFTVATSNTYPQNDDKLTVLSTSGNLLKTVVSTPTNAKYMIIYINDDITRSDVCKLYASIGDIVVKKEKKTDKKKVLYYDTETQTWKKPILHEWDSIEKHDNGKYYYHQRSSKRVYQSGDEDNFKVITDKTNTVYKLDEEKVFECTPIDLQSFEGKTNYQINSGPISPKSTLKCVNYIGNVISTLKEKVSNLEDKLYNTNLANFTVALNALDTKLKLEQLTKAPK